MHPPAKSDPVHVYYEWQILDDKKQAIVYIVGV